MTFQRGIRRVHKVLGVIVALQMLMWTASGLYMTAIPIDTIRGQHLVDKPPQAPLSSHGLLPLSTVLAQFNTVISIELRARAEQPVYLVHTPNAQVLLDASTGNPLPTITDQQARGVAQQAYTGNAGILSVVSITESHQAPEARGRDLPLWQVNFEDTFNTSIYVSAELGEIVAVRSDLWRVFDFFWMLHIMDYDERDDFNNPLVILMASLGLFLTVSGLLMLINVTKRKGAVALFK